MTVSEIIRAIELFAPPALQESYDNSGLQCGSPDWVANGALLSLDCTEAVIAEAVNKACNLVICHHPVIFAPLRRLTGANSVERTILSAIKNNVAIYACHTNADNVFNGVNQMIAGKLGLKNLHILSPKSGHLRKLVVFVPGTHLSAVETALFESGCGHIGNYDSCGFSADGTGSFRGGDGSKPFLGETGKLSREKEVRLETVFLAHDEKRVVSALLKAHPYEEVAYDIYSLQNAHSRVGAGMIGELDAELAGGEFLALVKKSLKANVLRYTEYPGIIKRVAVCGGSGRFLLKEAIRHGAQAFVTADFKYHDFFEVEGKLMLVDAGHYETEQFTPDIFYHIVREKFPTFAVRLSEAITNPVNYYY